MPSTHFVLHDKGIIADRNCKCYYMPLLGYASGTHPCSPALVQHPNWLGSISLGGDIVLAEEEQGSMYTGYNLAIPTLKLITSFSIFTEHCRWDHYSGDLVFLIDIVNEIPQAFLKDTGNHVPNADNRLTGILCGISPHRCFVCFAVYDHFLLLARLLLATALHVSSNMLERHRLITG